MKPESYISLLPEVTESNQPYWDGCLAGQLKLQHCTACRTYRFPESPICPQCLGERFTWQSVSGRGRLWSWIVMHQRYFDAFEEEIPYVIAFVKLDEGPYMISTLVDTPEKLQCDMKVTVQFIEVSPDRSIPKFRIAE